MKKVILILSLLFLANCTYKPLINPFVEKCMNEYGYTTLR